MSTQDEAGTDQESQSVDVDSLYHIDSEKGQAPSRTGLGPGDRPITSAKRSHSRTSQRTRKSTTSRVVKVAPNENPESGAGAGSGPGPGATIDENKMKMIKGLVALVAFLGLLIIGVAVVQKTWVILIAIIGVLASIIINIKPVIRIFIGWQEKMRRGAVETKRSQKRRSSIVSIASVNRQSSKVSTSVTGNVKTKTSLKRSNSAVSGQVAASSGNKRSDKHKRRTKR